MTSNINLSSLSLKFSKLFSFLNLFLAFSTLVFAKSVADPTYYKLLDVPYDADDSTLKKAYRKLALKHHPDKLPPDSTAEDKKLAEDKFAEISVAYDTLSNPDKRRMYDQVGVDGIKRGGGGGGGDDSGSPFGPGGIDPRKIFEQFFGGSGGGMGGGGMPNIDGASGFSFSSSGSGTSFSFTMHSGGGGGGSGAGGGGDPFADFFGGGGGGGGGGSNQRAQVAGPERGYFYEEGDEKDGSGGGGDDGSSDGGGGSGGDAPLITHIQENSDSDSSTFKKMMNEKNSRFIAVLFTEEILKNSYKDTAKSSIRKLAKTYRNVAPVYAADCRKVPKACSVIEPDVQAYPHVAFINGKAQETLLHRAISGPDATDSKKLNKFVADVFPGKDIAILSSMNEKEKFVASSNSGSNGGAASLDITMTIVFLTDKKVSSSNTQAIPPIIRGLSEELSGRVKFGIAGPKIDEVTFRSFSLDSDPKKHSLPCFYDVSSMKFFKKPGNQLRSYLISNYNVQQRLAKKKRESGISEITTLTTPDSSSTCGKKDSQFCLLVLQDGSYFSSSTVTSEDLLKVANSLKNDPVRVFWITPSKGGPIGGLYTEATKVEGFNDKNLPKILIWRPKRSKYEIYNPNPDNDSDSENKPDDSISEASYYTSPKIIDFVRSFLDGGKSLSKRHDDKIWDVEMGKMEL